MIYFIRHGESEANAKQLFAGQKEDSVLTNAGKEQAKETGNYIKSLNIEIDRIISSPLKWALEAAQIVASTIDFDPDEISIDKRIMEYDMGDLTGTPFRRIPSQIFVSAPNAEDPKLFRNRAIEGISEYQRMPGNTLIVSHAGVGRILESVKAKISPELFYDIPAYKNASVTVIDWIY